MMLPRSVQVPALGGLSYQSINQSDTRRHPSPGKVSFGETRKKLKHIVPVARLEAFMGPKTLQTF